MKFIILSLLLFVSSYCFSQKGSLTIHQSNEIAVQMQKHIEVNKIHNWVNGYRVQVYSVGGANSKEKANTERTKFLTSFANSTVYITYQAPYFKVRVGNFRTQLDALAYLQQIKTSYPFAFVVIDQIEVPR